MDEIRFLEILKEIRTSYPLEAGELTTINNSEYRRLVSRVKAKLLRMFPSLKDHAEIIDIFAITIIGFLDRPIVMLKFIHDKHERDEFMGKRASKAARVLLDGSKTRITNIRQIVEIFDLLETEVCMPVPEYFSIFRNEVEEILKQQITLVRISEFYDGVSLNRNDAERVKNAHKLHEIVYKFCLAIAR